MKYIVAGGRDFHNHAIMDKILSKHINPPFDIIISGCAKGADTLGAEWAATHGVALQTFPAKWEMYGKSAGFIRNVDMGVYADAAIIFWNGESKGTKHMIQTMKRLGKPYSVFNYKGELIESNGI